MARVIKLCIKMPWIGAHGQGDPVNLWIFHPRDGPEIRDFSFCQLRAESFSGSPPFGSSNR